MSNESQVAVVPRVPTFWQKASLGRCGGSDVSIFTNNTYYDTDDMVRLVRHAVQSLDVLLGEGIYAHMDDDIQVHIRLYSGSDEVQVTRLWALEDGGGYNNTNGFVIKMNRKDKMFNDPLERLAALEGDVDMLPEYALEHIVERIGYAHCTYRLGHGIHKWMEQHPYGEPGQLLHSIREKHPNADVVQVWAKAVVQSGGLQVRVHSKRDTSDSLVSDYVMSIFDHSRAASRFHVAVQEREVAETALSSAQEKEIYRREKLADAVNKLARHQSSCESPDQDLTLLTEAVSKAQASWRY